MSGHGEFPAAIDGLSGVEEVRPQYRHEALEVYTGTLDDGGGTRAVELRTVPAGAGSAVEGAFSEVVQSWWSVSDVDGVVDLLRWGLEPRPWALVADGGEETLATAWETVGDEAATDIVTAVGGTLAAASAEDFTHGNLRPGHVRLTGDDPAALVDDWGLGRAVAEAEGREFITGFTAPEVLDGSAADGGAVDTYGLAALAYFGLTERPPFPEERATVLEEQPQPVSAFRPDLPDAVDDLVMRGLRTDPGERPVGPDAFAAEFGDAMSGGGTAAGDDAAGSGAVGGMAASSADATAGGGATAGDDATARDESGERDGAAGASAGAAAGGVAAGGAGSADTDSAADASGESGTGDEGLADTGNEAGSGEPGPEEPLAGSEPSTGDEPGPLGGEDAGPLAGDDSGPLAEDDSDPLTEDEAVSGGQEAPAEPASQPAEPVSGGAPASPREPSVDEPSPRREPDAGGTRGAAEPSPGDRSGGAGEVEPRAGEDSRVRRRTVLAGGGLLAALAAVGAGAWAVLGGGGSGSGVDLSVVPDRAETVAAVDVAGLRESDALAGALNARLPLSLPLLGADTLAGVLDGVASRTGMDPAGVQQAVAFAARSAGQETYAALVLETDWDSSSLQSNLERAGESVSEETYADGRLFVAEYADLPFPVAVGEVGERRYAVGTRPEVEDVLETTSGSTPSVGGRQVEAFRAAADGQVRAGSLLPPEVLSGAVPDSVPDQVGAALTETARNVEYVSGSVSEDGEARLRAETGSAEAAETAAAQLRAASTLAADELGGGGTEDPLATLVRLLEEASVSREETTVTVNLASAYELLVAALAAAE